MDAVIVSADSSTQQLEYWNRSGLCELVEVSIGSQWTVCHWILDPDWRGNTGAERPEWLKTFQVRFVVLHLRLSPWAYASLPSGESHSASSLRLWFSFLFCVRKRP